MGGWVSKEGDRVFASQGSEGIPGTSISASISVALTVPEGASREWVEDAAKRGTQAGFDKFTARWQARNKKSVQIHTSNY